jgi:RNA polymerase sigma-70 factor (ECF subfamily)
MTEEASDDELVARAGRGDKAAFARLVGRHQARLLKLMTRSTGSRAAAEDIVQEVFIKAWVQAPRWQSRSAHGASYAAWLSRVAINLAIDQGRRTRPTTSDEPLEAVEDQAPLPDHALISMQRAAQLRAAMNALPQRQRLALSLTYDAELSNAEGAAAMDTTVGAFELLLVRARRTLREALRDL